MAFEGGFGKPTVTSGTGFFDSFTGNTPGATFEDRFNSPLMQIGLGLLGNSGTIAAGQDASLGGRIARGTQQGMQTHSAITQQKLQSSLLQEQLTKSKNERARKARMAEMIPSLLMGTPAETRKANPTDQFAQPGDEIVTKPAVPGLLGLGADQTKFLAEMGKENPDAVMGLIGQELFRKPGEMAQKVAMVEARLGRSLNQKEMFEMFGIGPDAYQMLQASVSAGQLQVAQEGLALKQQQELDARAEKKRLLSAEVKQKNNNFDSFVRSGKKMFKMMNRLEELQFKTGSVGKVQAWAATKLAETGGSFLTQSQIDAAAKALKLPVGSVREIAALTREMQSETTKMAIDDLSRWGLNPITDSETELAIKTQPGLGNTFGANLGILRNKVDGVIGNIGIDINDRSVAEAQKLFEMINQKHNSLFGMTPTAAVAARTEQAAGQQVQEGQQIQSQQVQTVDGPSLFGQ